jgi:hypothetical protein
MEEPSRFLTTCDDETFLANIQITIFSITQETPNNAISNTKDQMSLAIEQ